MKNIPVAKPLLGRAEAEAAQEAILSGWVTQGPRVKAFEEAFAAYTSASHACAVNNCTAALHIALLAVGVQPGDAVITVSHSFIATANAARACQAEPIFVDIDPQTFNLDPDQLERCLKEDFEERGGGLWYRDTARLSVGESPYCRLKGPLGRLGAILAVHQVGLPAEMSPILALARQAGVPVVEDAACAVGSEMLFEESWERIGRPRGEVACFSFHPRKVITTGDGGMLTTANPDHDRRFRLLRQHGMSLSDMERHRSDGVVFEEYLTTGYNYRLTDIQAAVGLEQLKRLPGILTERRRIAARYAEALSNIPGLLPPIEPAWARSNWQSYTIRLAEPARQRPMMAALREQGISTRRAVMSAHLEPAYAAAWPKGCLPQSELVSAGGVALPIYPEMTDAEVDRVVEAVRAAVQT